MTRNEKNYLKSSECEGEKPRYCRVCGEIIPIGCYYVNFRGKSVCCTCTFEMKSEEIIRICELKSPEKTPDRHGFTHE